MNEKTKLKERLTYLDKVAKRPGYPKLVRKALHTGTLTPRKGLFSKLMGSIKIKISTNLI